MTERFLHFVWQYQLWQPSHVAHDIRVLHPGIYNKNEGPDFLHAKIIINGIEWNGHVEIHTQASDWILHRHDDNEHYKNIILHVVYEDDRQLQISCPTISLKNAIPKHIYQLFESWMQSPHLIACSHSGIQHIDDVYKIQWIDRLIIERCEERYQEWLNLFKVVHQDWRQLVWVKFAEGFGMKVNNEAFRNLALNIPVSIFEKLNHHRLSIEAYLFTVSGLLPTQSDDDFVHVLQREGQYIYTRFPIDNPINMPWHFLRLRPANFPTIRISQLAHILASTPQLIQLMMSKNIQVEQWMELLNKDTSDYWQTHYTFHKSSSLRHKRLGEDAIYSLLINVIIPLHYFQGKYKQDKTHIAHAYRLLQDLKPERNHIIEQWKVLQHDPQNAYESQAYLYLYKSYCSSKRCVDCLYGQKLLRRVN